MPQGQITILHNIMVAFIFFKNCLKYLQKKIITLTIYSVSAFLEFLSTYAHTCLRSVCLKPHTGSSELCQVPMFTSLLIK